MLNRVCYRLSFLIPASLEAIVSSSPENDKLKLIVAKDLYGKGLDM
jgi:hypothetical protein